MGGGGGAGAATDDVARAPTQVAPAAPEANLSPPSLLHQVSRLPRSPWACGPLEMIQRIDMWLLWFVIFALQAGGILLTTNFGTIVESRVVGPAVPAASVTALFSATQSLGRLFGGVISDAVVRTRIFTRPAYFVVLTLLMAVAHAVLLLQGPAPLYIGVALAGWCFGSQYPVMIVTITELFGSERIASNYMVFDGFPGAVASLGIAKLLAQSVYQAYEKDNDCYGARCYNLSYICIIFIEIAATLAAAVLALRARAVYRVILWNSSDQAGDTRLLTLQGV